MKDLHEFIAWAGSQAEAGRKAGLSKLRMHRLAHGAPMRPGEAIAIEAASQGRLHRARLIFGEDT